MQISKHLHSCLLVEEQDKTIIIDPGIFTYQENALDLGKLEKLDYLLITHEHPDHMHMPFVKEIVEKFPDVHIISNQSIVEILQKENIQATCNGTDNIILEDFPHEKLWDKEPPAHIVFTLFDKLTHAGDSYHIAKTADVLALPIQAPWGSTTDAVNLALKLQPKVIIPIHDWMWKDGFRQGMYQRLEEFFKTKGIEFKNIETGDNVEI